MPCTPRVAAVRAATNPSIESVCRMANARLLGALGALALLAGCSDSGMLAPTSGGTPSLGQAGIAAIPTPAEVIVPGATVGSFTNTIVADNSGRATTEFWDNFSVDDVGTNHACNIGFFATDNMASDCLNEAAGSDANAGGYAKYWGDGTGSRDASAFMFSGDFEYNVTLLGSYAGSASEVGWFTKSGGTYVFHPVASWSARTVGSSLTINTSGDDWGFYIRNSFNSQGNGCQNPEYDCSDAEGGFTADPHQQFALMLSADGSRYLVGTEDEELQLTPPNFPYDSDYNDYIFEVEPVAVELLNGRMTGGGGKVVSAAGADVTFGFTLHCDITLSNNLEINWAGNSWHLDKPITSARCEDDPAIAPRPPVAPFDTFHGEALGRLNGVDGSRVEFTFVDDGEGGNSGDKARITIYAPGSNTVVLDVPLTLTANGNIQAHYDQPHGQKP